MAKDEVTPRSQQKKEARATKSKLGALSKGKSDPQNEPKKELKNQFKNLLENEPEKEEKKDVFASISIAGKHKALEFSPSYDEADTLLIDNWGCELEQSLTGSHSVESLFESELSAQEAPAQSQDRTVEPKPEKPAALPETPAPQIALPVTPPVEAKTAATASPPPAAKGQPLQKVQPPLAKAKAEPLVAGPAASQAPVSKPVAEPVAAKQPAPPAEETIPECGATSQQTPESLAHLSEAALQVIAGNPRTSPSILCWLAAHYNPEIRCTVARNSNALPETVWLLAKDHDQAVRLALAEHLESNRDVLKALCNDPSPLVSWRAQNTLSLVSDSRPPQEVSGYGEASKARNRAKKQGTARQGSQQDQTADEVEFLLLLAQKSTTPGRRLTQLATNPNASVRAAVAENGNTPLEALWMLVKDSATDVKVRLADNYNCPLEIVEILAKDSDQYVGWRARTVLAKLTGKTFTEAAPEEDPSKSSGFVHSQ